MHITVYSARPYDRDALSATAQSTAHTWQFLDLRLDASTCLLYTSPSPRD